MDEVKIPIDNTSADIPTSQWIYGSGTYDIAVAMYVMILVALLTRGRNTTTINRRISKIQSLIGTPACCAFLFMIALAIIISTFAWRAVPVDDDANSLDTVKTWMIGYWIYLSVWFAKTSVVCYRARSK